MRDYITFENVRAKAETVKAVLCQIDGNEYWVPKSQITDDSDVYRKGDFGDLVVTLWWAERTGLDIRDDPDPEPQRAAPAPLTNASRVYRRLALENHPDRGGDLRVMRAVNELWDAVKADLKRAS